MKQLSAAAASRVSTAVPQTGSSEARAAISSVHAADLAANRAHNDRAASMARAAEGVAATAAARSCLRERANEGAAVGPAQQYISHQSSLQLKVPPWSPFCCFLGPFECSLLESIVRSRQKLALHFGF